MSDETQTAASKRGKRSRRKGASWERELAARWVASGLYPDARRGIGQARSGGEVPDVDGTNWWCEAKCQARPNVYEAMAQAIEARAEAKDERPPLVVARRCEAGKPSRAMTLVCLRLEDFEDLIRAQREGWESL